MELGKPITIRPTDEGESLNAKLRDNLTLLWTLLRQMDEEKAQASTVKQMTGLTGTLVLSGISELKVKDGRIVGYTPAI